MRVQCVRLQGVHVCVQGVYVCGVCVHVQAWGCVYVGALRRVCDSDYVRHVPHYRKSLPIKLIPLV